MKNATINYKFIGLFIGNVNDGLSFMKISPIIYKVERGIK